MTQRPSDDNRPLSPARRQRPGRDTRDNAAGVIRQIRAIGRSVAAEDPSDLALLEAIREALDDAMAVAIAGLRASAFTDADIGAVLGGVTKQAVQKRWPREHSPNRTSPGQA